jgi:predicted homoserine dehydrogenase-like protein
VTAVAEIALGVVGTGFIARNLMSSLVRHDDLKVTAVLTRREIHTVTDVPEELLTNSIDTLIEDVDVIVECSGDPVWATEVVGAALSSRVPVVTMNTEFHITAGSAFVGQGIVTEAEGDQPGCLAALHEEAVAMGFEPLAYGNMKGFLNLHPKRDEMEYWGAKQNISLPMVTSFTDGTKVQAEQILVGNHFGATIATEGMMGPSVGNLEEGAEILGDQADIVGRPITDFVVNRDLPHGVFLVVSHAEDQQPALEYYKLGPGPKYTLIRNNILVHLEIPKTIRRVVDNGKVLLDNSACPELSLGAVAKRGLKPGERIDHGIGSFEVRGHALRTADHPEHVPIGLIRDAVIQSPVERGQVIDWSDLDTPDSRAKSLWTDQILPRVAGDRADC